MLFALLCSLWALAVPAAELHDLRLWDSPEGTRVVLELDRGSAFKVFTLANPERIVIDLPATVGAKLANAAEGKGVVQHVRAAERQDGSLRVVLDMARAIAPRSFLLDPTEQYGYRLVLDLATEEAPDTAIAAAAPAADAVPTPAPTSKDKLAVTAPAVATAPAGKTASPPAPAAPAGAGRAEPGPVRPIVVAIDAGHGGEDPGAIGKSGLQEKEVSLRIARKLARLVDAQPGYRAVLTRDGDYYLPLRERVRRARRVQADLFVSVHANALSKPSMHGSAVYVVSPRGATNEHARWVAQKENAADLVGGIALDDKDDELAAVLIDLSQSSTMEASFDVGGRVLKALGQVNPLQKAEVQQAAFVVLKAPDIPSVLVETAFITNPQEERMLGSDEGQGRIAESIFKGVRGYFESYRPHEIRHDDPMLRKVRAEGSLGEEHRVSRN